MAHPRALSFSEAAALLSSGRDVTDALTSLATLGQSIDAEGMAAGNDAFLSAMCQASLGTDPRQALSAIGRPAQEASTPAEDVYLGLFGTLDGIAWPAGFRCTAIDTDTGELVVWDEGSGVPLLEAVASSCAVPMLFPIVTIKGRRYMDGGILSHLNATAAPPTDVLVVLSCIPSTPVAPESPACWSPPAPKRMLNWHSCAKPDGTGALTRSRPDSACGRGSTLRTRTSPPMGSTSSTT